MSASEREPTGLEIAIVGMAGCFPGAPDLPSFWQLLCEGREGLRRLDLQELMARGRDPADVQAPEFVPVHGVLDGFDQFDADFFGYRLREAEAIDPQQRLFLEVAWHALEDAGYDPAAAPGAVGVFAGAGSSHYLYEQLHRNPAALARVGAFQAHYSNQPDHLAARVAYKLNLSGVAVAVQSACSTSLVAVHLACQHLLTGACDMALAGGVSITLPRFWGYRHEEGMILSPDGHCRTFDARAQGTLKGDGAGVVVLKRLADALADGDTVQAVILGSAANNDGAAKVGYTAPGLDGQVRLITAAQAVAGVSPDSIGYVEAHGTGTPLGDPIEVAALTQAFRQGTDGIGFCGLGSVKTNIGHLDAAAGVAALIKTVLALRQATWPASLHFETANPALALDSSPFRVVQRTQPWPPGAGPRRAAVSAFGIGGTNAHVVLEAAPAAAPVSTEVPAGQGAGGAQLLLLSARTPTALAAVRRQLAARLGAQPALALPDVACTLATGRHAFSQRAALVVTDTAEAARALDPATPGGAAGVLQGRAGTAPAVVFLFPGQGAQHPGMGRGLYAGQGPGADVFRSTVDHCCEVLRQPLGLDLRSLLLAEPDDAQAASRLQQTGITQPALFVVEYALARALMAAGIEPAAMAGHSLGEYVAACLAGVFTLDDALALVAERARLMQAQPPGAMLSVPLDAGALAPLLAAHGCSLAAENAPGLCVAAGPTAAVEALAAQLLADHGLQATRLHTSHAFHSPMMAAAVAPMLQAVSAVGQQPPARRFVSSVTGTWFGAADVGTAHWGANLLQGVRFGAALSTLYGLGDVVMLEVGPGATLTTLARRHADAPAQLVTATTLAPPRGGAAGQGTARGSDEAQLLRALGQLWCAGVDIGQAWLGTGPRRRVSLPGYPFERQRCWVDPAPAATESADASVAHSAVAAAPLLYRPAWVRAAAPPAARPTGRWLLLGPARWIEPLRQRLAAHGAQPRAWATDTEAGAPMLQTGADDPGLAWLADAAGQLPEHLLILAPPDDAPAPGGPSAWAAVPTLLHRLAQQPPEGLLRITLGTRHSAQVLGDEPLQPDQVLPIGWLQVLPCEWPGLRTTVVDLEDFGPASLDALLAEAVAGSAPWVAYRRGRRWERSTARVDAAATPAGPSRLRPRGVYAISGGLGHMGLALAEHLARTLQARLLLFSRSALAPPAEWDRWLQQHAADDPVSAVIRRLRGIEALGAELMLVQADVTDETALAAAHQAARARWGAVHGLVHAAGLPGAGLVALQSPAQAAQVLAAKREGTQALLRVFGAGLDFVVLCSSLTSFVALPGRAAYTAANLWLDAFAQSRAGQQPPVLALNWDNWREGGMARAAGTADLGLTDAQGVAALVQALAMDEPQWLVSMRALPTAAGRPLALATVGTTPGAATGQPAARVEPDGPVAAGQAVAAAADATPAEAELLRMASDLLGVPAMGLHDDFFDLGGDSVVGIQLVSRARRAGWPLTARQVFELRTVAAMAAAAQAAADGAARAAATVTVTATLEAVSPATGDTPLRPPGPTPDPSNVADAVALSPIQHWFFGLPLQQPGHWNLGLVVATPADLDPALLRSALQAVVAQHPVLQQRFVQGEAGWQARQGPPAAVDFESVDLSAEADEAALQAAWHALAVRAQRPFDLAAGGLLRAVHAQAGTRPGRLFIGLHHLVADLIAARLLLQALDDELQARLRPPAAGAVPARAAVAGTPWARWTECLVAHAQSAGCRAAAAHWSRQGAQAFTPLPRELAGGANTHDSSAQLWLQLNAPRTAQLLARSGGGTGLAGALLAALAQAVCGWSGQPHLWVEVEGHGRTAVADELDVSRSIGWFTAPFPVCVAAGPDPLHAAQAAARALREAPLGGMSFGLLRHLHADPNLRAEMAALPVPEVVFLFEGAVPSAADEDGRLLHLLDIQSAPGRAGTDPRSHVFEVHARLEGGCLQLGWGFSRQLHAQSTVQALLVAMADALQAPAQAPVQAPRRAPLSFAQERIWFLQQLDAEATVFNKQCLVMLEGELDLRALQAALDDLRARHDSLRTRFVLEAGTPYQCIEPPAPGPLALQDLAGADDQAAHRLARELACRPFDLGRAPPWDLRLLRLAPDRHALLLTLHHIVTDAWSLQVLVGDLARLYAARQRPPGQPLPPLPRQFSDFAQAQRQALSGEPLQALLAHWTQRLAGLAPLDLPADRPRPAVQRFDGARVHWRWPAPLTAALRTLGRSAGCSPFMVLLALYKLLLYRYTGQTDIVVGSPSADRPDVDTESLLGPLVNNLVLRTDLQGAPDMRELLARVRHTVLEANEHRDLPFEKLVEALRPTRDRSRSPLFQVMFAYMNVPPASAEWPGLRASVQELDVGGAEFDLSLYAYAPAGGEGAEWTGWFEYSTALFDAATIERLAGHLQALAEAACRAPDQPVTQLPLMAAAERAQVIDGLNRTAVAHAHVPSLQALVEQQVARRPGQVAAVFDDVSFSYAELDRRANRLARHLRTLGVQPDDRVAVCIDRVGAMLVALLATLKAGAAYVPVDPGYPDERVQHMVADSAAVVVLTQARWRSRFAAQPGRRVVCLDQEAALLQQLDGTPLPSVTQPGHLAYVIYTSGSTGLPKGTQIEHGAVVNFLQAMQRAPGLQPDDALLAVTTISFDIHVLELFLPLCCGARVVVASRELAADGARLRQRLEAGDITAMQATPATWRMLLEAGWAGHPRLKLLCGGEALASDLAAALLARCDALWNLYGPTEATVWATSEQLQSADAPISIGRPFDNMRAYVLDAEGQPLPVGVPGELCLGGAGVARGYLNRPQLDAERFRPDPFLAGGRLYRTGDLARWRPDGRLDVLGRLDHQVKLRGHRVELGEIEAVLGRHAAVAQCVCVVREDRPGDQRLVAYLIGQGAAAERPALPVLRQFAAARLPDYMLPSALVWLDAYPLTPNNKVDRRALPAPAAAVPAAPPTAAGPLTPAQAFFADIFSTVLGQPVVQAYDNFFDLGGHSLLAMKVVDLAQQRGGIRLHPGELFQQTVGQLAALHGARLGGVSPVAVPGTERVLPRFFSGAAGSLYGCLHPPLPDAGTAGHSPGEGLAVLLCPPIGPDYARSHRALRQLAAQLARRGAHVLRFDYHGLGDSEGESEALRLDLCRRDIGHAIDELQRRSGLRTVALAGLRLGATLALQAAAGRTDVSRLLLWHPVWDGRQLLAEWRAEHQAFLQALGYGGAGTEGQALGVPLPDALVAELQGLADSLSARAAGAGGAAAAHWPPQLRCLLAEGPGAHGLPPGLAAAVPPGLERRTLAAGLPWQADAQDSPVPADTLRLLADWLAGDVIRSLEAVS